MCCIKTYVVFREVESSTRAINQLKNLICLLSCDTEITALGCVLISIHHFTYLVLYASLDHPSTLVDKHTSLYLSHVICFS